jgi:hypothetical protein
VLGREAEQAGTVLASADQVLLICWDHHHIADLAHGHRQVVDLAWWL